MLLIPLKYANKVADLHLEAPGFQQLTLNQLLHELPVLLYEHRTILLLLLLVYVFEVFAAAEIVY